MRKKENMPILVEWCDPERQVRISVEVWHVLQEISGQYIERHKDWRMVLNYMRYVGIVSVIRKIRSRLAEERRNRKVAAVGVGEIIFSPFSGPLAKGQKVAFLAPNHPVNASIISLNPEFVISWPSDSTNEEGVRKDEDEAMELLRHAFGWSYYSGIEISENKIKMGLKGFVGRLENLLLKSSSSNISEKQINYFQKYKPRQQSSTNKPTAVLFGLGNYAKTQIIPNIKQNLQLSRIHEIDPDQLKAALSWGVVLDTSPVPSENEKYDAWFMAGYHHTHGPLGVMALEQGAYAVLEKPLVTTKDQYMSLLNIINSLKASKFFGCFHKRYSKLNDYVYKDIKLDETAPVDMHCIVYEIPLPKLHWYNWPNSGSRIISNGCHWLDYFLFVNDYIPVSKFDLWRLRDGDLAIMVMLENGANLVMSLTDKGSERLGVRDVIELRKADTTIRIIDMRYYESENSSRVIRKKKVNPAIAYKCMYQEISSRIARGEEGDAVKTLRSTKLMLDLEDHLANEV